MRLCRKQVGKRRRPALLQERPAILQERPAILFALRKRGYVEHKRESPRRQVAAGHTLASLPDLRQGRMV
jgi:hypothetical protein